MADFEAKAAVRVWPLYAVAVATSVCTFMDGVDLTWIIAADAARAEMASQP
jgi:hypothetical protein